MTSEPGAVYRAIFAPMVHALTRWQFWLGWTIGWAVTKRQQEAHR